jgi:hypothetical protein
MSTTEDRARAAMLAIAGTVYDAPPLRLPRSHAGSRARRFRWRPWLVPLAAAAAVAAVGIALVIVRTSPDARRPPVPDTGSGVPPYYVALARDSASDFAPAHLIVGNTLTGARLATLAAPRGGTFAGVTGAADDRTFAVDTQPGNLGEENQLWQPRTWYLLRLSPGAAPVARLTRLPIPVTPSGTSVDGFALSPDGTRLAVALQLDWLKNANAPVQLRIYSVASGAVLRSWSAAYDGSLFDGPKYSGPDQNSVITWLSDNRTVAFESLWTTGRSKPVNGSEGRMTARQMKNVRTHMTVRLLDTASPGTGLIADSRVVWSTEFATYENLSTLTCGRSGSNVLLTGDGKTVVCGAIRAAGQPGTPQRQWTAAWLEYSTATGKVVATRDVATAGGSGISFSALDPLWSGPAGVLIGYLNENAEPSPPGGQFAVYRREGKFTTLPIPPTGGLSLLNSIAW